MSDLVDQADALLMRDRLRHLYCVTMQPGSWDKRFIADVWQRDPATLSVRQVENVMRLAWKYRRQMPGHLVPDSAPENAHQKQARRERGRRKVSDAAHDDLGRLL